MKYSEMTFEKIATVKENFGSVEWMSTHKIKIDIKFRFFHSECVCRFYMNYNDEFYRKSNKLKQTMLISGVRGNGLLHTWYLAFNSARTRAHFHIDGSRTHMHAFIHFLNRANCSEQMSAAHIQLRNRISVQSVRDYVWQTQ